MTRSVQGSYIKTRSVQGSYRRQGLEDLLKFFRVLLLQAVQREDNHFADFYAQWQQFRIGHWDHNPDSLLEVGILR